MYLSQDSYNLFKQFLLYFLFLRYDNFQSFFQLLKIIFHKDKSFVLQNLLKNLKVTELKKRLCFHEKHVNCIFSFYYIHNF